MIAAENLRPKLVAIANNMLIIAVILRSLLVFCKQ